MRVAEDCCYVLCKPLQTPTEMGDNRKVLVQVAGLCCDLSPKDNGWIFRDILNASLTTCCCSTGTLVQAGHLNPKLKYRIKIQSVRFFRLFRQADLSNSITFYYKVLLFRSCRICECSYRRSKVLMVGYAE